MTSMGRGDKVDITIRRWGNEKERLKSILQWTIITVHPSIGILLLRVPRITITPITWHLSTTWTESIVLLSLARFEPRNLNNHTPSNVSQHPSPNTATLSPQNPTSPVPPQSVKVRTISSKTRQLQSHHTIIPISTMRFIETGSQCIPLTI